MESHIKGARIRRQLAATDLETAAVGVVEDSGEHRASPFESSTLKPESGAAHSHGPAQSQNWAHPLPVVAAAGSAPLELEDGGMGSRGSLALARNCAPGSLRGSGPSVVYNTEPVPDLLPPGGERAEWVGRSGVLREAACE
jgi:hypothetical protein